MKTILPKIIRPCDYPLLAEYNAGASTGTFYGDVERALAGRHYRCALDIGASLGVFSLYLLDVCPPDTLLAFEPNPESADVCAANLEGTGVVLHRVGIYYGATRLPVYTPNFRRADERCAHRPISDDDCRNSFSVMPHRQQLVPLTDLYFDLCPLEVIPGAAAADFVKLDVEGAEYNILEHSPIVQSARTILLESHYRDYASVVAFLAAHLPRHTIRLTSFRRDYFCHFLLERT